MQSLVNVRDQVREHLITKMQKGKLQIGKTINLAALSRDLGVSVTPIREALTQLQQSQIIQAIPNRGFIVGELQVSEAKNLYELVANMESLALEESDFEQHHISQIRKAYQKFEFVTTPLEKVNADYQLHGLLTRNYGNPIAQRLLKELKTRLFFYELHLAQHTEAYKGAHNQHYSIISAIEENNKPTAALILKMNWQQSLGYMQKMLAH